MNHDQLAWLLTPELRKLALEWTFPAGSIYLNHGSFGAPPRCVRDARNAWTRRLEDQPMNFYLRELEPALHQARNRLAEFVGTSPERLALVDNATYGMNVIAHSLKLQPGDEVLINNHEYGAVKRIWERACREQGATLTQAKIELPVVSADSIVDAILDSATPRTRLIVASHITSATAITLPAQQLCQRARERNIPVCIDGPHAIAQLPLNLDQLGCAFYTASCHKWLCAPLGSGLLYVAPEFQSSIQPPVLSWGRLLPNTPDHWDQEFWWLGTRDPSAVLTLPVAIDFLEDYGLDNFRNHTHRLAKLVRNQLTQQLGTEALTPDSSEFYGCMTEVRLPTGDWSKLQEWLWKRWGIEVPIISFEDEWFIRVSVHLYTRPNHLETLFAALQEAVTEPSQLDIA